MLYHAHGFVDGAYLRELARTYGRALLDPYRLLDRIVMSHDVQSWAAPMHDSSANTALTRVTYYDARPDDDAAVSPELQSYWDAVELLQDTQLGFGSVRGRRGRTPPRQKGVDTLIAVDILVGAFTRLFSVAVLVSGDADFVPVLDEVRRRGVQVMVAGDDPSVSSELRRAADRFISLNSPHVADPFPELQIDGRTWRL